MTRRKKIPRGHVKKSQFAELAGVSRPAVSRAVRLGRVVVTEEGLLDLAHPDNVAYIERHQGEFPPGRGPAVRFDPMTGDPLPPSAPAPGLALVLGEQITPEPEAGGPALGEQMAPAAGGSSSTAADLAARRRAAVSRGGSGSIRDDAAEASAAATAETKKSKTHSEIMARRSMEMWKLEEQARLLKLKNDEIAGRLLPRDLVQKAILDPLETEQVRLLSDGSSSITALVYPAVQRGDPPEEVEKIVRSQLSTFIKARKRTILRLLKTVKYAGSPDKDLEGVSPGAPGDG